MSQLGSLVFLTRAQVSVAFSFPGCLSKTSRGGVGHDLSLLSVYSSGSIFGSMIDVWEVMTGEEAAPA